MRSTFAMVGVLFLPFSIWFAWSNFRRNWVNAVVLFVFSIVALVIALDRREASFLSGLDDL